MANNVEYLQERARQLRGLARRVADEEVALALERFAADLLAEADRLTAAEKQQAR